MILALIIIEDIGISHNCLSTVHVPKKLLGLVLK